MLLLQTEEGDGVAGELFEIPKSTRIAWFGFGSDLGAREGPVEKHAAGIVVDVEYSSLDREERINFVIRIIRALHC